jgi:selenocysteine lyase/cysteine desulfurase
MEGLGRIEGIALLTHPAPDRSAAVVTFRPAGLDPGALARALYERDRIAGAGRPEGLRLSPHLYNSHAEVERAVSAVRRYVRSGL